MPEVSAKAVVKSVSAAIEAQGKVQAAARDAAAAIAVEKAAAAKAVPK